MRASDRTAVPGSLSGAFRALLPPEVQVVDSFAVASAGLHPDEERAIEGTRAQRREQFMTGRMCARQALEALGVRDFPVLPAADRAPVWPAGITGSITHAGGFCAAAAARQDSVTAVGIDTEQVQRIAERLWPRVCTPRELSWLQEQPEGERQALAAAIFSAKEAAYKCQYQLTRRWIALGAAEIELEQDRFHVQFLPQAGVAGQLPGPVGGQFAVQDGFVLSAAVIARR